MSELDDNARELLSQARRALSPSRDDEARLLQRTLRAIESAPLPRPTTTTERFMRSASRTGGKLVVALSIAGLSGSIGYVVGQRAGRAAATLEARAVSTPPVLDLLETVAPMVPAPVEPQVAAPARNEARARTRTGSSATAKSDARASLTPPVDEFAELKLGANSSLELEVRFMKAVERALRDNDPGRALRVLDELQQAVPQGSLDEERHAASVMARCRLGLGDRAKLIDELTSRYPASAYVQRVQDSCRRRQ